MADHWMVLDLLTWVVLMAPPTTLLLSALLSSVKARMASASWWGLGEGGHFPPEVSMDPKTRELLEAHALLNRTHNFTLAFLENTIVSGWKVLPEDPAQDSPQQKALRQQLQADAAWIKRLREAA